MAERFLIRALDGPNCGTRVAEGWSWPLPHLLLTEGGAYVKTGESTLPPQEDDSGVLRGAEYRWQPGDPTSEQFMTAIAVAVESRRLHEVQPLLRLLAVKYPRQAQDAYDVMAAAVGACDE